jgi:hypothetical protein
VFHGSFVADVAIKARLRHFVRVRGANPETRTNFAIARAVERSGLSRRVCRVPPHLAVRQLYWLHTLPAVLPTGTRSMTQFAGADCLGLIEVLKNRGWPIQPRSLR